MKHAAVTARSSHNCAFNFRLSLLDELLGTMAAAMTQKVRLESVGGDVLFLPTSHVLEP